MPIEGCYVAGVFNRSKASQKLEDTIASARWPFSNPPDAKTWAMIKNNQPVPDSIKLAHTKGVAKNDEVTRQSKLKDEQDRQQRIAQYRAEIAAEKQKKNRVNNSTVRGSGNSRQGEIANGDMANLKVVSGPFDGLSGSSFLNALYKADWQAIDQFNMAYRNRKIQQFRRSLGVKEHWLGGTIEAGFKSYNLTNTVLAVYLFDYDSIYASCLKKDAVTFQVVNHVPGMTVHNLLGQEVSRSYGYTSRKNFKVNSEFKEAFRLIGRTKPEGLMSTISDLFLNQGGTDMRRELIRGTKESMSKYSCDCQEIKQLEKNLLKTVKVK